MESDRHRVKKKTVQSLIDQCQKTIDQLQNSNFTHINQKHYEDEDDDEGQYKENQNKDGDTDYDTDELCDLVKKKVESHNFLEKLGSIHMSTSQYKADDILLHSIADESASWDIISAKDLREEMLISEDNELDQDGYVLVKQEDIVEGIACFMAAYLLSLEQTKELTPNQLQEVLSKTFSVKKKKSKLRKVWDGSKVIYNVASWSATAVGIYQNPVIFRAASVAFLTSCRIISKLL